VDNSIAKTPDTLTVKYPWPDVEKAKGVLVGKQRRDEKGRFASGGGVGAGKVTPKTGKLSVGEQLKKDLATAAEVRKSLSPKDRARLDEYDKKVKASLANGEATNIVHKDKNGNWTPERQKLQQEIEDSFFKGATPVEGKGRLMITGGLPGSGKSTVLKARGNTGDFDNVVHVDSDAIKGMLPEYKGWNAAVLHEESSEVAGRIMARAREANYNVVYDATMKNGREAKALLRDFGEAGNDTSVVFVDIPLKQSMERAAARSLGKTNRYVPLDYIATHDSRNLESLNDVKKAVGKWEHWDNSQPYGQPPTLVASRK